MIYFHIGHQSIAFFSVRRPYENRERSLHVFRRFFLFTTSSELELSHVMIALCCVWLGNIDFCSMNWIIAKWALIVDNVTAARCRADGHQHRPMIWWSMDNGSTELLFSANCTRTSSRCRFIEYWIVNMFFFSSDFQMSFVDSVLSIFRVNNSIISFSRIFLARHEMNSHKSPLPFQLLHFTWSIVQPVSTRNRNMQELTNQVNK